MSNKEEDHTRGTVVSVAIGLAAAGLGGILFAMASLAPPEDQSILSGLGMFLLVVGVPMFFIAVLVELFAIGTCVRSVAKSHEATVSLLKKLSTGAQASELCPMPTGDKMPAS